MINNLLLICLCSLLVASNCVLAQEAMYGAIDTTGQTVIPFEYNHLSTPAYGVLVARQGERIGLLDTKGELIAPFHYTSISSFENGMASYSISPQTCGYMDTLGQAVIPAVYDRCQPFHDSLAWVGRMENGELRYGVINRKGAQIIPFLYEEPGQHLYMEGRYKVKQDGLRGVIDRKGRILAAPQYQRMGQIS